MTGIVNMLMLTVLILSLIASKVFCSVYLRLNNLDDNTSCFKIIVHSTFFFSAVFILCFLLILISLLNIFKFPLVLNFAPAIPILIILFYVIKEHEFTFPSTIDQFRTYILCRPSNIVTPDNLSIVDSTGGIFMGPTRRQAW